MPLLKDGQPFELLEEVREKYQSKRIYMVPESVVRINPETKKLEVPNSWSIGCSFQGVDDTGKKTTWRYYTHEQWDENSKKMIYFPEYFVINGPLGFETVAASEYDLHYYLEIHKENEQNPKRQKYYSAVEPRFRTKDLSSQGRLHYRNADRMKHLFDRIMPDCRNSWDYDQLVRAMEAIVTDRQIQKIPYDILNYPEYKEMAEKHKDKKIPHNRKTLADIEEGMRGALYTFAAANTSYCYELWILGERLKFITLLDRITTDPNIGVTYDATTRQLLNTKTQVANNKVILTIPNEKDDNKYTWKEWIAKECQTDRKLADKIYALAGEVNMY